MGILHFLDVGQGDCSIIEHPLGRITVIDCCKARSLRPTATGLGALMLAGQRQPRASTILSDFASTTPPSRPGATLLAAAASRPSAGSLMGLSAALRIPTTMNPIRYMRDRGMTEIFRFILTHPDMDHMDGIKDLFAEFNPANFWDTANTRSISFATGSPYREADWRFYKGLRDGTLANSARRLTLHAGAEASFYNQNSEDGEPHDGLYILAPTPALVDEANRTEDFNDTSYVILYRSAAGRILFCGDAHDKTFEHLVDNHLADIQGVELMIAPHHGRDSGRDRSYLSEVRPKVTLIGVAPSQHLAYDAWSNRDLDYITTNSAGTVVVDTNGEQMQVYVANENYARGRYAGTTYSSVHRGWHLGYIA